MLWIEFALRWAPVLLHAAMVVPVVAYNMYVGRVWYDVLLLGLFAGLVIAGATWLSTPLGVIVQLAVLAAFFGSPRR